MSRAGHRPRGRLSAEKQTRGRGERVKHHVGRGIPVRIVRRGE